MSGQGEKGKFSANISQDVIDAALQSVDRRKESRSEVTPIDAKTEEFAVELEAEASAHAAEPTPVAEAPPDVAAGSEVADAALRQELEDTRAQLELSQQKSREMLEKVKESHERMLRAVADLDNYKKRAQKEKDEVSRFGTERLLKDFLPVIDNLERALEHARAASDLEALREGVAITRKLFEDTLGKHGVKSFSAKGQPFDPRFHEAMSQVETSELPPAHVVFEAVRGYMLNDRLVRPALVTVSLAPVAAPVAEPVAELDESRSVEVPLDAAPKAGEEQA